MGLQKNNTYLVAAVNPKMPCQNCTICLRLRILEMGILPGETVRLENPSEGMWILNIIGTSSRIGLRQEELDRITFSEIL